MTDEFIRERITSLRIQKGVSEYKMSYDLGHSRGYINNISSGKSLPSMVEFLAICEYFEISPITFFDAEIGNPKVMNQLNLDLQKLSDEDVELVRAIVKRLLNGDKK